MKISFFNLKWKISSKSVVDRMQIIMLWKLNQSLIPYPLEKKNFTTVACFPFG